MSELHLKVFANRSELVRPDGTVEQFLEGSVSENARLRYAMIQRRLDEGWLHNQIARCKENPASLTVGTLSDKHTSMLDTLVASMTSEQGRGLLGLTIIQLTVKCIAPEQNIRLHKGGSSGRDFSWREGISMRSLDNGYFTPALRQHGLLTINRDGSMMTRSLAENYPYTQVYKAYTRGARSEWAGVVEDIEAGHLEPEPALQYLLSKLINNAQIFKHLADSTLHRLGEMIERGEFGEKASVLTLMWRHIDNSNYAARIMEIAMHSLMQAAQEVGLLLGRDLVPLSQMRSANKKHGNVGDIELKEGDSIVEAWDAKFGRSYLRDELEELAEKLAAHPSVERAGFVTSVEPERLKEIEPRRQEIADIYGVALEIVTLDQWVGEQFQRAVHPDSQRDLAIRWIRAYTESLAQRRPQAPIDEPCYQWLSGLKSILDSM